MKGNTKERWEVLCEQVILERDPGRQIKLLAEINLLLSEKHNRLNGDNTDLPGSPGQEIPEQDARPQRESTNSAATNTDPKKI